MGLFGRNKPKNNYVLFPPQKYKGVNTFNEPTPCDAIFYLYYPSVIKTIPDGQLFYLDLIFSKMKLISEVTETQIEIQEYNYALGYNGKVIGVCSYANDVLREYWDKKINVRVAARKNGYVSGFTNLPNIKLYFPKKDKLKSSLGAMVFSPGAAVENIFYEFRIYTPSSLIHVDTAHDFICKPKIIPTPKGSKAKPHIGFYDGSELIFELSAQNNYYSSILELVDKDIRVAISKEYPITEPKYTKSHYRIVKIYHRK